MKLSLIKLGRKKRVLLGIVFILLLGFSFFSLLNLNRYLLAEKIEQRMDLVISEILQEEPMIDNAPSQFSLKNKNFYLADRYGNGRAEGLFQDPVFLKSAFEFQEVGELNYMVNGVDKKFMVKIKPLLNGDFYYAEDITKEKEKEQVVFFVFTFSFLTAVLIFFFFRKFLN